MAGGLDLGGMPVVCAVKQNARWDDLGFATRPRPAVLPDHAGGHE